MRKKWYGSLLRQRVLVVTLLILQLAFMVWVVLSSSKKIAWLSWVLTGVSVLVALHIVNKKEKGAFKLAWIFPILLFPIFGGLFYLFFHLQSSGWHYRKRQSLLEGAARPYFALPGDRLSEACEAAPEHAAQLRYLQRCAGFPVYGRTAADYLSPGERMWESLLKDLRAAEKYIFIESFIVEEGKMWNSILAILEEKARAGVEVRLLYDDIGCFFRLPKEYPAQLAWHGIQCKVFNPFRPLLRTSQNNRDHRKITSIDGKIAYTGGINLADEYINAVERFGHWKDASVRVEGEAAWSLTLMFLQMWPLESGRADRACEYYPWAEAACPIPDRGFVQPYADSPLDEEHVSEHVYTQMIAGARRYLYICSPYLIVDDNLVSALTLAAKSGVDVRIITPHQPDKLLVHMTTRSYYRELIRAGVHVYEYSKGFLHSKIFISDDETATIGTANLDFRSLYLHFECGVWLWRSPAVEQALTDFRATLSECQEIGEADCAGNAFVRFLQDIIRLFAPLM